MTYLLFISYSRNDRDSYLERFYNDLRSAVRALTAQPEGSVGYWDSEATEFGTDWSRQTFDALKTSRLLLAICSPSYFNSTRCGKEFETFQARNRAVEKGRQPLRAIFPVFWQAPRGGIPLSVAEIRDDDGLPPVYVAQGLRYMMRLNRFKAEYAQFVDVLARKLTLATQDSVLPPLRQNPTELTSAFHASPSLSGGDTSGITHGLNTAHFVFVAAPRSEMVSIRKSVEFYGENGGWDWRPFNERIGGLAQAVASTLSLRYSELPADASLAQNVLSARSRREPVLGLSMSGRC